MEKEIWKDVVGYEGLYCISSVGRVKSIERFVGGHIVGFLRVHNTRILKYSVSIHGYSRVALCVHATIKHRGIHRLVAEAFISNPENKPCVNHKNGIKTDNRIENLEWVTYSENAIHALKTGLSKAASGENTGKNKLTKSQALSIRASEEKAKTLAKKYNISEGTIYDIRAKRSWANV